MLGFTLRVSLLTAIYGCNATTGTALESCCCTLGSCHTWYRSTCCPKLTSFNLRKDSSLQKLMASGPRILSHLGLPSQSPPPSRLLAVGGASASRRGHQAAVFVECDMMLTRSLQLRSLWRRERRHSSPRSTLAPRKRCWLSGISYQCGNRSRTQSTPRFAEPGCVSESGTLQRAALAIEEVADEENLFCRNAFRTCPLETHFSQVGISHFRCCTPCWRFMPFEYSAAAAYEYTS